MVSSEYQHRLMDRAIFSFVSFLNTKLWSSMFIELDVCGRLFFANLVTYSVSTVDTYTYRYEGGLVEETMTILLLLPHCKQMHVTHIPLKLQK